MRRIEELAYVAGYGFDTLNDEGYAKSPSLGKPLCVQVADYCAYTRDFEQPMFEEIRYGRSPMELAEAVISTAKRALAYSKRRTTTFAVVAADKHGFVRTRSKRYLFHTTQRVGANGEILVSVTWDPTVRVYDEDVRGFLCYLRDLCKARNEMLHAGSPESLFWE